MSTLEKVQEWHDAFGVPVLAKPTLPPKRISLRLRLLREELTELEAAVSNGDIAYVLHEMVDLQYVLDGMFLELGLHPYKDKAFAEVHRANMSKLGPDGRPVLREDGKVLKGPGFVPADVEAVLRG